MTQLLQQAIAKVNDLAPTDQDAIAAIILEELQDEHSGLRVSPGLRMPWLGSLRRSEKRSQPANPGDGY